MVQREEHLRASDRPGGVQALTRAGRVEPRALAIAAAIATLAVVLYLPALGFEFVNYDDPGYVTANAHVREGLSARNVGWALAAFQSGNWHPLTLLSHMTDVSLYGLAPRGHHATSLLLHALNAALLFWLLRRATGRTMPSATVAAWFAVHPLQVQSVAWISERKNVLCALFWLLALLAWTAWRGSGAHVHYATSLACAALALAAKPMAVTLPFTLVLLDHWPLRAPRRLRAIVPFLVLSLACGIATLVAQREVAALQTLESYPLAVRTMSVPLGYCWYLVKTVVPTGLAVFYPHPHSTTSMGPALMAAIFLVGVSVFVLRTGKRRPFLATGWWWYVITLAPVSGIVQVGSQAFADRYAYVPLVGIFVAVAFGISELTGSARRATRVACAWAALASVVLLFVACRSTLAPWRDSEALFRRAVAVVPDSAVAHNNLGMALVDRGRTVEAVEHFRAAVRHAPWDTDARSNLGSALTVAGDPQAARAVFEDALRSDPDDPGVRLNLANALVALGKQDEAARQLEEAMRIDPSYAKAPLALGNLYVEARRLDAAVPLLSKAVELSPSDPRAQFSLGIALAATGRKREALARIEEALRLDPAYPRAQEVAARLRADLARP